MKTLTKYLKRKKLRVSDMARKLEISQPYMTLLCQGKRTPSLKLAIKIERITGGEVPVSAW